MGIILSYIIISSLLLIIVNKLWCFWSRSKVCLVGKTAIVTGGASGLGYQTVLALAAKGCRVIIADIANISQVVEDVIKESHNPNIIGKKIDLASFTSVREFVKDILDTESRLDILICNAGIGEATNKNKTTDGLQKTMQVNYFSHFLLTHLLIDLLKKSAPSRIVFTSSLLAYVSTMTVDEMNPSSKYISSFWNNIIGGTYNNSKLALAAAAKMFGEKLKGTRVTANVLHPAGVKTPIFKESFNKSAFDVYTIYSTVLWALVWIFGKNAEEGAQTMIHLAQSDEVKYITGQSFVDGRQFFRPFQLNNDKFCNQIWDSSVEYTKLQPSEIKC